MSGYTLDDTRPAVTDELRPEAPVTGLEVLRQKRAEAARRTTIDMRVPGYDGVLVARYRLLDPLKEGKQIGERIRSQFKGDDESQLFFANVDTLIEACVGLFERDPDTRELAPIDPEETGEPVRYDHRLAAGLGITIEIGDKQPARTTVLGVFNGNKVAINRHAGQVEMWMADPTGDHGLGER